MMIDKYPGNKLATDKEIKRWMMYNANEYETATKLVESAIYVLDLPEEWLDDDTHEIWDWAIDIKPGD